MVEILQAKRRLRQDLELLRRWAGSVRSPEQPGHAHLSTRRRANAVVRSNMCSQRSREKSGAKSLAVRASMIVIRGRIRSLSERPDQPTRCIAAANPTEIQREHAID